MYLNLLYRLSAHIGSRKRSIRIKTIPIFLILVFSHLAYCANAQRITIAKKNAVLTDVFAEIRKQTGFDFILPKDLLKKANPVTISFSKTDLTIVLDALMENQPFTYKIQGKGIIINDRPVTPKIEVRAPQNQILVKGTVTDSLGISIVGASVKVRDTNQQTITDRTGNFVLKGVPIEAIIEISYLGHQTRTIKAAENLKIVLKESSEAMKDVVVTGLFSRKADSFTGSTATFSQKELLQVGNVNLIKSLANLDPSFRIMENLAFGSDPNRLPDIQLRGQTGLPDLNNEYGTNPNLPLFILDGFETNLQRIIDLDMYLVKSITLLKDAASKAVYGSRAANGVVVIETLRPSAGALQVTYNYNLNVELPDLSSYSLANARQKLDIEMLTDPRLNSPGNPYYGGNWFYSYEARAEYDGKLEQIIRGVDTDWLPEPLRNGFGQRHSLNLGGGRDELRYYVELGYNDIQGVMKGSERKAYSGGIQLSYRRGNVSVNNILGHAYSRAENSPYGSFQLFADQNPYLPARNADGSFPFLSPLYNGTVGVQDFAKEKSLTNNTELIWNILPELRFNGRVSFSNTNTEADRFLPSAHNSFAQVDNTAAFDPNSILRGSYAITSGLRNLLNTTLTLSYNRVFNKHSIYANAGADANSAKLENYGFKVVGFPNQNLNFPAAALQFSPNSRLSGTENLTRDMGFYSAINYTFDDRYLADVSVRRMRSSQFGSENPSANFWSAGLGWNIHKESFME
jgi:TonB-linked SusC/RagA family outer membrane protein